MADENAIRLLKLARERFGEGDAKTLSEADETLFTAVGSGEPANYTVGDKEEENDPALGQMWQDGRVIRADRIEWLCIDPAAREFVTHRGVYVIGARIDGELDLREVDCPWGLSLVRCCLMEQFILKDAEFRSLDFKASHVRNVNADNLRTKGAVFLNDGFKADGEVRLRCATIGTHLECTGGRFICTDGDALSFDNASVRAVFLNNGFCAEGAVRLPGAKVDSNMDCSGGQFNNKGGVALFMENVQIAGHVFLSEGFVARGSIRLLGATVGGTIMCRSARITDAPEGSLVMDGVQVQGDVFLDQGFMAEECVRLPGSTVIGQVNCQGAHIEAKSGVAFIGDNADIKGSVFLNDGFRAEGVVCLLGVTVAGDIRCTDGQFTNPNNDALTMDGARIKGGVFLNGEFRANGLVHLIGVKIGGPIVCTGGQFTNPGNKALAMDQAEIKGGVFLNDGFRAEGVVRLHGVTVGGQVACVGGQFTNPNNDALVMDNAEIKGAVFLHSGFRAEGVVRLHGATVGGQLACMGGQFINPNNDALSMDNAEVKDTVFLGHGFRAEGEVRLLGMKVGGQVVCRGGQFINSGKDAGIETFALVMDSSEIKGSVFLDGDFQANGTVRLMGSKVNGSVYLVAASDFKLNAQSAHVEQTVEMTGTNPINADWRHARVDGLFDCRLHSATSNVLDMRSATVGTFRFEIDEWPSQHDRAPSSVQLSLAGLEYDALSLQGAAYDRHVDWLRLQYNDPNETPTFHPQAYEQLATVLRRHGREKDAKKVWIAKNVDEAKYGQIEGMSRAWHKTKELVIGYGYSPEKLVGYLSFFLLFG